jgi:glycosyltransferase involved in cell wall biosynthesis
LLGGGEKSIIESIRRKVAQRGLASMLDMPGYVDRYDLPEQLTRAHIFAAPSRYEGGPGFVYLEAMACGLPVIACLGSGAAEIIRDGRNGLMIPPDDVSALSAALRRLLSNREERELMAVKAQMYVRQEADSKLCVDRIARYYQTVIAEEGAAQAQIKY